MFCSICKQKNQYQFHQDEQRKRCPLYQGSWRCCEFHRLHQAKIEAGILRQYLDSLPADMHRYFFTLRFGASLPPESLKFIRTSFRKKVKLHEKQNHAKIKFRCCSEISLETHHVHDHGCIVSSIPMTQNELENMIQSATNHRFSLDFDVARTSESSAIDYMYKARKRYDVMLFRPRTINVTWGSQIGKSELWLQRRKDFYGDDFVSPAEWHRSRELRRTNLRSRQVTHVEEWGSIPLDFSSENDHDSEA